MSESTDEDRGSNGLKSEFYLATMRELLAADREKDKAVANVRVLLKRLKDAGGDMDAISLVRKLRNLEDDERISRIKALFRYAQWEGLAMFQPGVDPGAVQDEMFDEPSPEMQEKYQEARIHSAGYNARVAKGARDLNPQMAGSSFYQMWDRGWLDAEHDLNEQGKTEKVASTERRPHKKKKAAETPPAEDAETAEAGAAVH